MRSSRLLRGLPEWQGRKSPKQGTAGPAFLVALEQGQAVAYKGQRGLACLGGISSAHLSGIPSYTTPVLGMHGPGPCPTSSLPSHPRTQAVSAA